MTAGLSRIVIRDHDIWHERQGLGNAPAIVAPKLFCRHLNKTAIGDLHRFRALLPSGGLGLEQEPELIGISKRLYGLLNIGGGPHQSGAGTGQRPDEFGDSHLSIFPWVVERP